MKKILLFVLITFLHEIIWAQTNSTPQPNFYKIQQRFYQQHPEASPLFRFSEHANDSLENNIEEKFQDGVIEEFRRWEQFMEPRVYPSGNIFDPGILMREYLKYKQEHSSGLRSGNWQLVGPDDVPQGVSLSGVGRINTIAIDPQDTNIIYVGAPCGGLWKSTDGGSTWSTNSSDLLPSISIGDIAINPLQPDILYVATGDSYGFEYYGQGTGDFWGGTYSAGVMKSEDGGNTWSSTGLSYNQSDAQLVYRVVVNPATPDTLFAATRGGLYRSMDGGANWTNVKDGYFFDVEFNAADPNTIYAADDSYFYYSNDEGSTWTSGTQLQFYSPGSRISIAVTPANANYVYAYTENGDFYVSTNGGLNFSSQSSPAFLASSQGVYDVVLAVSPVDENKIVAAGINLVESTDGGSNWEVIGGGYSSGPDKIHPDFHAAVYYPNDDSRLIVGNDGGVFRSSAGGTYPWNDVSTGMAIKQYYRMANSVVDEHYILAGAQDNGTDKFDGNQWTHILGADGMQPLVDYLDDNVNYASSQGGNINRSIDGSLTFGNISPTDPENQYYYYGHWTTPFVLDPVNHHTIYYGGDAYDTYNGTSAGVVLKSTDDGITWTQILSGDVGASDVFYRVRVAPSDNQTIYASTIGQIFRTSNGGTTWSEITGTLPSPIGGITDMAISNIDPMKVWVTLSGYNDGEKVYASDNGGSSWTNISGTLPNIPVSCIAFQRNANNLVYIGTDFGVFYLNDDVSDWQPFNDGLPNVMVTQLDVLYSFNKLRAATYGRSIWETDPVISTSESNDAGLLAVLSPNGSSCDSIAEALVRLKNFGLDSLHTVTIKYSVDGGALQQFSWSGTLAPQDTTTVNLGSSSYGDGSHELIAFTFNPNGLTDDDPDNDARSGSFSMNNGQTVLPIQEGFESGIYPPALWHPIGTMWGLINGVGGFNQSDNSITAQFYYINGGQGEIITPIFNYIGVFPPALLTFDHAYAPYSDPGYTDSLEVKVSTDCFATSTTVFAKSTPDLATAPDSYYPFSPDNASQWREDTVDLSAYIGMSGLQVSFVAVSGYGNNLYLDNVNLNSIPLTVQAPNENSFDLYPNPTDGETKIIFSPDAGLVKAVDVFDNLGRNVFSVPRNNLLNSESMLLSLSALPKGLYFVHLGTSKGTMVKKVVLM